MDSSLFEKVVGCLVPDMKNVKARYFFLGLILFYLIIFFSPNKPIYFSAYFVATFFFYLSSKDIRQSLLLSLILSLFSDMGLAGSLTLIEPKRLNLGSGYLFSPMTVLVLMLLPFSLTRKIKEVNIADIVMLLFLVWNTVSLIIFPNSTVLYGIMSLGEMILVYYLLRIYIAQIPQTRIISILISMVLFQAAAAFLQVIFKRPLGLTAEAVIFEHPLGFTTVEEEDLFRVTGTFGHPNIFASFLLSIIPFLLLYSPKSVFFNILKLSSIVILFFTYSRAAWFIFILVILYYFLRNKDIVMRMVEANLGMVIKSLILFFGLFAILSPYLFTRIESLPAAFEKKGSMDVRLKLLEEGWHLFRLYPATGVGLNSSVQAYVENPATDLFYYIAPSKFYRLHNTFLEIAVETGIVGILLFLLFIYQVIKTYFSKKRTYLKDAAYLGLLGFIGISLFNPLFHSSQFRLFFLLAAIILT